MNPAYVFWAEVPCAAGLVTRGWILTVHRGAALARAGASFWTLLIEHLQSSPLPRSTHKQLSTSVLVKNVVVWFGFWLFLVFTDVVVDCPICYMIPKYSVSGSKQLKEWHKNSYLGQSTKRSTEWKGRKELRPDTWLGRAET